MTRKTFESSLQACNHEMHERLSSNETKLRNKLERNERNYKDEITSCESDYASSVSYSDLQYEHSLQHNVAALQERLSVAEQQYNADMRAISYQLQLDKQKHWFGSTTKTEDPARENLLREAERRLQIARSAAYDDKWSADNFVLHEKTRKKAEIIGTKNAKMKAAENSKIKADTNARVSKAEDAKIYKSNDSAKASITKEQQEVEQLQKQGLDDALAKLRAARDDTISAYENSRKMVAKNCKSKLENISSSGSSAIKEIIAANQMKDAECVKASAEIEQIEKEICDVKEKLDTYTAYTEDIEALKHSTIMKIQKYQTRIIQLQGRMKYYKDCVQSLQTARAHLKYILDFVKSIKDFWVMMESFSTTNHELHYSVLSQPEGLIMETCKSKEFKSDSLYLYSKWVALKEICENAMDRLQYSELEIRQSIFDQQHQSWNML